MRRRSKYSPPTPDVLGDDLIGHIAGALKPSELTIADRASMHSRILQKIQEGPPPGTFTIRAADMQWVNAGPGVEVRVLRKDVERNDQTVLIRMQPGAVVVAHRHNQEEECLVLEGEVFIGNHHLGTGDMHVARPGATHDAIRAPDGALLMIRSEMPPSSFRIA